MTRDVHPSSLDRLSDPYQINPVRGLVHSYPFRFTFFILSQVLLVMLLRQNAILSTLHALFVLFLGLFWLLTEHTPERVIYVAAYIVGFELIWRGTGALVFWEYGKYAVILLLILLLFKERSFVRAEKRSLVYFVLLLPAILLVPGFDREIIAFQLSGPFLLALATLVFSTLTLTRDQFKHVLVALIAPAVGLAFMVAFNIITIEEVPLSYATAEVFTSGIGANQVSSILGLGALATFLYIFVDNRNTGLRIIMFLLTIWLLNQAALTFSRGGFWSAIGAIAVAAFYLIRHPRVRAAFLFTAVLLIISYIFFFPTINDLTGGELAVRLRDFEQTGRVEIMRGDLQAFKENPIFGVGIGQSIRYHALFFRASATHTEYSRLLAEHGFLGILAFLILFWLTLRRVFSRASVLSKAVEISLTVWALLFMYHAATRLAAPGFLFGLAAVTILVESDDQENDSQPEGVYLPRDS